MSIVTISVPSSLRGEAERLSHQLTIRYVPDYIVDIKIETNDDLPGMEVHLNTTRVKSARMEFTIDDIIRSVDRRLAPPSQSC